MAENDQAKTETGEIIDAEISFNGVPFSPTGNHAEWLWGGTGVVVTILAIVFWGFLFVLAGGLYLVGIYKAPWFAQYSPRKRFRFKAVIDALIVVVLFAIWLYVPTPDFAKGKDDDKPSVVASPSLPTTAPAKAPPGKQVPTGKQSSERSFVEITPDQLVSFYRKYEEAQADSVVQPYIGKWMTFSGEVSSVSLDSFVSKENFPTLSLNTTELRTPDTYIVMAGFEDESQRNRVVLLNRGDKVTVTGKLKRVMKIAIILEQCELVETK